MKKLKEFKTIMNLAKENKFKLMFFSLGILISGFSSMMTGILNGKAVEEITNFNLKNAIIFLFIYLFSQLFFNIIQRFSITGIQKWEIELTRKINYLTYEKTLALPAYAFEEKTSGEFINRITNDSSVIINSFDSLISLASNFLASFIILIYIFFNSPLVAFEIILFIIIFGLFVNFFQPKLEKAHKERKKINDMGITQINESVRGIREIKTLGVKTSLFKNLKSLIDQAINKSFEEIDLYTLYDLIGIILKSILEVGTFITCAILLYYGHISLTFFIAITYYIYRYTWIIENLTAFTKTYNETKVALSRINEILENKLYNDVTFGNTRLLDSKGVITFSNVTFAYPNESDTLKNFSITFEPHKKIGIVGKSGQGKTTIFNLLTRVFDPNEGKILLDNVDIRDLTEESLRKNISIIRQDPFLFNKTIRENFKLLKENITLREIRKYTKMAYIDDYIMSLPKKYDTILGEGGVNLSGGQKQRLAIARALAKKSQVILFDEATSSLDNESQNYIKKVIDELVVDHTIIIVAHRLSTIKDADIIYVIDDGQIKDFGTHKELMKKSSIYKRLYNSEEK